eukprot:1004425-Prymnesium_polylepis.1
MLGIGPAAHVKWVAHWVLLRLKTESYTSGLLHVPSVSVPSSLPHSTAASDDVSTTRLTPAVTHALSAERVPSTAEATSVARPSGVSSKPYLGCVAAMWKTPSQPRKAAASAAVSFRSSTLTTSSLPGWAAASVRRHASWGASLS